MEKLHSDMIYSLMVLMCLCTFFYFGYKTAGVEDILPENQLVFAGDRDAMSQLFKVLINNLAVGFIILLGSLFYTFLSFATVGFTGYITGVAFAKFSNVYGLKYAMALLLPHGFLEVIWLVTFTLASIELSNQLLSFFKKEIDYSRIINSKIMERVIFSFALVFISAFIEIYISPNVLFYFN